jgi:hypothetical protein
MYENNRLRQIGDVPAEPKPGLKDANFQGVLLDPHPRCRGRRWVRDVYFAASPCSPNTRSQVQRSPRLEFLEGPWRKCLRHVYATKSVTGVFSPGGTVCTNRTCLYLLRIIISLRACSGDHIIQANRAEIATVVTLCPNCISKNVHQ